MKSNSLIIKASLSSQKIHALVGDGKLSRNIQTAVLVTERKSPCGERIHKELSKVKGEWQLLK